MKPFTLPSTWADPASFQMDNIVLHWTGSRRRPSDVEFARSHYHAGITPDGEAIFCNDPFLNYRPSGQTVSGDDYIAHAGQFNTRSIGLFLTGMGGSAEGGRIDNPFTQGELDTFVLLAAWFAEVYDVPIQRIFTHSAIRPIFGRGSAKWDVNWTPGTGHMSWDEANMWFREQIDAARQSLRDAWDENLDAEHAKAFHAEAAKRLAAYIEWMQTTPDEAGLYAEMLHPVLDWHRASR